MLLSPEEHFVISFFIFTRALMFLYLQHEKCSEHVDSCLDTHSFVGIFNNIYILISLNNIYESSQYMSFIFRSPLLKRYQCKTEQIKLN